MNVAASECLIGESERSRERYRLAAWGALANVGSRAAGMVLMVATVRWAAPYLGTERFGVWATFASLAAMLSFLDLGLGNAMVNRVARASAGGDRAALEGTVSGGIAWLALVAVLMSGALAALASVVPWQPLFKLSSVQVAAEARTAALTFSVLFGLHLLSSGALKVLAGQQRSHEAHVINAIAALLACLAVAWVAANEAPVAALLAAGFGVQSACGLMALALLAWRGLLRATGLPHALRAEWRPLLSTGSLFLLLQIGTMIGWGSDTLLLASFGGAQHVAAFAVAQRLFQFASQPMQVLNAPLWSAYADAAARGERAFLRKTLRVSVWASVAGAGLLSAVLLWAGPWLVGIWTSRSVSVPWSLLAVLAIWTVLEAGGTAFGAYLNGVGVVREQAICVVAFCVVALPLKVYAAKAAGAPGLVAATILSYTLIVIGLYLTVFRTRVLRPLREA
jgi:O-antigen/teichoic acid export membrane protein